MKPDAIIVTGDITDEGILPQLELARVELERFKCRELIVLPGNHDYRHTGYLLFKKFFPSTQTYDMGDVLLITLIPPDQIGMKVRLDIDNLCGCRRLLRS